MTPDLSLPYNLPQDILIRILSIYLTLFEVARLDIATSQNEYREILLNKCLRHSFFAASITRIASVAELKYVLRRLIPIRKIDFTLFHESVNDDVFSVLQRQLPSIASIDLGSCQGVSNSSLQKIAKYCTGRYLM